MAGGAYTQQQQLIPMVVNLGANVAAGTTEAWPIGTIPSDVPIMHLISATLVSGTTVTLNASDYNVWTIQKGSTVMATLNGATTNLPLDVPVAFTRTATVANQKATAADVLTINKTPTLNGTAGTPTIQGVVTLWFRVGTADLNAT